MKTTIDLPDMLLVQAKKLAAEEHCSLKSLVEAGLEYILTHPHPQTKPRRQIQWVVAEGTVPAETADRAAMYDWLERES
jgi:hypothetical protein